MIKLELTVDEVNVILSALGELPYKVTAELIAKVRNEGQRQFEEQNPKGKFGVMPEGSGHGV